jgi:PAS domain S-box-containing protein
VPIEVGLTPVVTSDGVFVVSTIVDVSERRLADERFKLTVESSPSGMLMIDRGGRVVLVNREIERMFGYTREELIGQPVDVLVPQRYREAHPGHRAAFFADPQRRPMGASRDLHGVRKDGVEFPVEIGLNPIETSEGLFVLSSVVDISARRETERERRMFEEQQRQAQKMEAVGRLASGIAHDFKNLLAGILGCSGLALRAVENGGDPSELLREIKSAAERGAAVSRQLLDFGRERTQRNTPFALNIAVRATERMLRMLIGEDLVLSVQLSPASEIVVGDRTHVEQVLTNLALNARDAMPDGGELRVVTRGVELPRGLRVRGIVLPAGRYACLEVTDAGTGMDAATQQRLFEPFFTTKDPDKGTGLGLYTAYGIVRQMGGAIDVVSAPGRGSSFTVYFPCADESAPDDDGPSEARAAADRGGGETLLVVEDERLIRATLAKILRQHGYVVLVASDPQEALAVARAHAGSIDLLLTDVVMPGSSGVELARALSESRPRLKVVFMSAFPPDLLVREHRIPPSTQALEKPFEDAALLAAIRAALGRASSVAGG